MAGWFPIGVPGFAISQRSTINVNFVSPNTDHKFINHVLAAEQWGPAGSSGSFWDGTTVFHQIIGSNGYPNTSTSSQFGGGIWFPAGREYGDGANEFYVLRWTGTGTVGFAWNNGSSTLQAGLSSNYTVVNSSRWSGTNPYIVFQYSGPVELVGMYIYSTDGTLANLELYRLSEESDRDAGLVYRMAYKNMLKALDPSAIRFMDWHGSNVARQTRWEYRTPPNNPSFGGGGGGYDWVTSPKYGRTSGTNQYMLSGVTGTPASMTHGEIATFQFANAAVRTGSITVSDISNAANGRVTTGSAHGFNTGDKIFHIFTLKSVNGVTTSGSPTVTSTSNSGIANGMEVHHKFFPAGTTVLSSTATTITMSNNATGSTGGLDTLAYQPMPKMHMQPCTITVVDSTHYDTGVDTTAYGTFSSSTCVAEQFITLQVGSGNDRTDYPIIFESTTAAAAHYGAGYISANDYKTVIFDKTIAYRKDTSGNWVYGVWLFNNSGSNNGHRPGVAVELCVALVNEVNALSPVNPVHMYLNMPHLGTSSMDPDYSAGSNYGVKCMDVVLNGSTVAGKTWAGLTSSAHVFLEYSNETWNSAGDGFAQSFYLARRGFHRWNNSGLGDYISMAILRSSYAFDDIRQAIGSNSRIHYVMGCWGTQSANNGGFNDQRMAGTTFYQNDALVTGNARLNGVAPLTYPHDIIAFASYIDANLSDNWDSVNLASLTTSWVSNIGNAAAQEANCASYVAGQIDAGTAVANAGPETIGQYLLKLAAYSTKVATYGSSKKVMQYEGGWDHSVTAISAGGLVSSASPFAFGSFTSGNTTISGINSSYVSALSVGDFLYGYGLPADCQVASKPTSTSITVTVAPTITDTLGEFVGFTQQQAFLRAVKRSQAWSNALKDWFDAFASYTNCGMPADYIIKDIRWGHTYPTAHGFTNTEWGDLAQAFLDQGTRNRARSI